MLRRLALASAALAGLLALPGAAQANITCQPDPVKHEMVILSSGFDLTVQTNANGTVSVLGAPCSPISMSSIDRLVVKNVPGSSLYLDLDLRNAPLGPGLTPEPGGVSDLEFAFEGGDLNDALQIIGGPGMDRWAAGTVAVGVGVNLDVGPAFNDVDVVTTAVEGLALESGAGKDDIDLRGGSGFTGPLSSGASVNGGADDDELDGGPGPDFLDGYGGNDVLRGHGGDDVVDGGTGDDVIDGAAGQDRIEHNQLAAGVRLALATTTPQNTGGAGIDTVTDAEDARGTQFADVFSGTPGVNRILGADGPDVIDGGGGADDLAGENGTDTVLFASAGGGVTASLTAGTSSGAAGSDVLKTFESIVGSPYGDALTGDDKPNTIDAGGGDDTVDARGANDTVLVRDQAADSVVCGAGSDAVTADHAGLDTVDAGCEATDRSAAPAAPEPPAEPPVVVDGEPSTPRVDLPPPVASLRLLVDAKPRQRIARRRVAVSVVCPDVACTAAVKVRVRIGGQSFALGPVQRTLLQGRVAGFKVALSPKVLRRVRAALAAKRRVTVRATVQGAAPGVGGAQAVVGARLIR